MHSYWAYCSPVLGILFMVLVNTAVCADECQLYAEKSVEQHDRNLFNLCGFRGVQWSNDIKKWRSECEVMSLKDQKQRLQLRESLLSKCPTIPYLGVGRNYHQKLSIALMKAVESGSYRRTEMLIQAGANVSGQPEYLDSSVLFIAIKNNYQHIVRLLVRSGAKPYLAAKGETNVLSLLLQNEDTNYALFEFLLKNKANPNFLGKEDGVDYPIVIAAAKGDFRSVDLLLRYKADPNLYLGRSALQLAVEQDNYPISRSLINNGANPNLGIDRKRCDGLMALDLAFRNAKERVVDLLMDNHALAERECR